jgi:hypothetical protein
MNKTAPKQKPRHPKLSRLKGLMSEYEITGAQLAKSIGRASTTVSKSLNGWSLFDSNDLKNIQKIINSKAEKYGKKYSIEEIFYSRNN